MKKQMKYANDKGISFVCMIGAEELASGTVAVKSMGTGEQENISMDALSNFLKEKLK
jgi:histidyl-tRNA synthetase